VKHPAAAEVDEPQAGVSKLAARYDLPGVAVGQLVALLELLTGDPLAPTNVRDPRRVLDDHLADALVALELESVRAATRIADIGAGAGVPGLPLAMALPGAQASLVESTARKCEFIARAIDECAVTNACVVCARAEAWPQGLERFDLVTARALAPLPVVAEYAAPLLELGGTLVAWRGRRDADDEAAGAIAAGELGLRLSEPLQVWPYSGVTHRHLQVMVKVNLTPRRFPRRPGMARKRPLGVRG
jgi:16S rRNA (guanine527-N7)-methyltransferase